MYLRNFVHQSRGGESGGESPGGGKVLDSSVSTALILCQTNGIKHQIATGNREWKICPRSLLCGWSGILPFRPFGCKTPNVPLSHNAAHLTFMSKGAQMRTDIEYFTTKTKSFLSNPEINAHCKALWNKFSTFDQYQIWPSLWLYAGCVPLDLWRGINGAHPKEWWALPGPLITSNQ